MAKDYINPLLEERYEGVWCILTMVPLNGNELRTEKLTIGGCLNGSLLGLWS